MRERSNKSSYIVEILLKKDKNVFKKWFIITPPGEGGDVVVAIVVGVAIVVVVVVVVVVVTDKHSSLKISLSAQSGHSTHVLLVCQSIITQN
jgi:hypothetical protein